MSHKKSGHHPKKHQAKEIATHPDPQPVKISAPKFEVVLKCDSTDILEAVKSAVWTSMPAGIQFAILHAGIGAITKSDVFMAETGSRLIIGFNVDVSLKNEHRLEQSGVEIRIYDVIYKLVEDLKMIAASLLPIQQQDDELILGEAKVIALFKSRRRGIILGCEIEKGRLNINQRFRVISAMGPVYSGIIESLHIEKDAVTSAHPGQQVGLKIKDFKRVHIGDKVESFKTVTAKNPHPWIPTPQIMRK